MARPSRTSTSRSAWTTCSTASTPIRLGHRRHVRRCGLSDPGSSCVVSNRKATGAVRPAITVRRGRPDAYASVDNVVEICQRLKPIMSHQPCRTAAVPTLCRAKPAVVKEVGAHVRNRAPAGRARVKSCSRLGLEGAAEPRGGASRPALRSAQAWRLAGLANAVRSLSGVRSRTRCRRSRRDDVGCGHSALGRRGRTGKSVRRVQSIFRFRRRDSAGI